MNKLVALEPCLVITKAWYDFQEKEVKDEDGAAVIDPLTDAPKMETVIGEWTNENFYDQSSIKDMPAAGIWSIYGANWASNKANAE